MSETANRDANRKTVGMAATDDVSLDPTQLRVDPVTKRLKATIVNASPPATSDPTGKRDGNHVPTVYAVTDDAAQDVVPVGTDANGFILVDINIE